MSVLGRKALLFGFAGMAVFAAATPASADICDLTTTSSCTLNGGVFTTSYSHTITSDMNPFLALQRGDTAAGYNTSARSYSSGTDTQLDEVNSLAATHNLKVSDVGTKTIAGKTYLEFFLDVDGSWGSSASTYKVTLDQLEIFVSNTANLDKYSNSGSNNASGSLSKISGASPATKIYDLDTATKDNWVNLSYSIGGSGGHVSDMSFLLDASLFAGYDYVYMYSQFGDATPDDLVKIGGKWKTVDDYKYPTKSGKTEEWFTDKDKLPPPPPPPSVPEPSAVLLMGVGLAVAARRLRKA